MFASLTPFISKSASRGTSTAIQAHHTIQNSPTRSIINNISQRSYAVISRKKAMRDPKFRGAMHKRKAVERYVKRKIQFAGMDSMEIKQVLDKNKTSVLPQWKPETEFDKAYHKYNHELHFYPQKRHKSSTLIEVLNLVENSNDLTRFMQLWRLCLKRPIRFSLQFSEALISKLLDFDEVDAAASLVSYGKRVFLPISRPLCQRVVERLADEGKHEEIGNIFKGAVEGYFIFTPHKEDYLFFLQHLKGQQIGLDIFFSHPKDVMLANRFLPDGHEEETYDIALDICKELNATREAEHICLELLHTVSEDAPVLEKAKEIVTKLREEHPVQEEETEAAEEA